MNSRLAECNFSDSPSQLICLFKPSSCSTVCYRILRHHRRTPNDKISSKSWQAATASDSYWQESITQGAIVCHQIAAFCNPLCNVTSDWVNSYRKSCIILFPLRGHLKHIDGIATRACYYAANSFQLVRISDAPKGTYTHHIDAYRDKNLGKMVNGNIGERFCF